METCLSKQVRGLCQHVSAELTAAYCNTHCNTLQYTVTRCITLQVAATHYNTLQQILGTSSNEQVCELCQHVAAELTATHCNTLQCIATHCDTLQHTATHHNRVWRRVRTSKFVSCVSTWLLSCRVLAIRARNSNAR